MRQPLGMGSFRWLCPCADPAEKQHGQEEGGSKNGKSSWRYLTPERLNFLKSIKITDQDYHSWSSYPQQSFLQLSHCAVGVVEHGRKWHPCLLQRAMICKPQSERVKALSSLLHFICVSFRSTVNVSTVSAAFPKLINDKLNLGKASSSETQMKSIHLCTCLFFHQQPFSQRIMPDRADGGILITDIWGFLPFKWSWHAQCSEAQHVWQPVSLTSGIGITFCFTNSDCWPLVSDASCSVFWHFHCLL